eukprot:gene36327-47276_t
MANSLAQCGAALVVGVVGAGHLEGIERWLGTDAGFKVSFLFANAVAAERENAKYFLGTNNESDKELRSP